MGPYTVNVSSGPQKLNAGLYNVHLYYVQNVDKWQVCRWNNDDSSQDLEEKSNAPISADLTIAKSEKGRTFTIAKAAKGFDGYKEWIPFWSHANGMKRHLWYTPTRRAGGSYTVTAKASDHENADGKYDAGVFLLDAQVKALVGWPLSLATNRPMLSRSWSDHYKIWKRRHLPAFTITARNLQGFDGYKEVKKIPFWSHVSNEMKDHLLYSDSPGGRFLYCNS